MLDSRPSKLSNTNSPDGDEECFSFYVFYFKFQIIISVKAFQINRFIFRGRPSINDSKRKDQRSDESYPNQFLYRLFSFMSLSLYMCSYIRLIQLIPIVPQRWVVKHERHGGQLIYITDILSL